MAKKLDSRPHRAIKWVLKISTFTNLFLSLSICLVFTGLFFCAPVFADNPPDLDTYNGYARENYNYKITINERVGTTTAWNLQWESFGCSTGTWWAIRNFYWDYNDNVFVDQGTIIHSLCSSGIATGTNMITTGFLDASIFAGKSFFFVSVAMGPTIQPAFATNNGVYFLFSWDGETLTPEEQEYGFQFSVVSPASGSTITDIENNITFEWENWDFEDIWVEFLFWFIEENTGLATHRIIYEPLTESGQVAFPFSDFEFEKNADYYLKARRSSVKYGQELIYPDYWIKVDIEGWEYLFEMPDWETWYSENVEQFATPTAVFSGFAGFISPIFNKIGEFGNTALKFLDTDEAYDTGYNLGANIPLFNHYVDEIEVFFGGFPIIRVFLGFMVILIGIFIVRLILKFIPGLG